MRRLRHGFGAALAASALAGGLAGAAAPVATAADDCPNADVRAQQGSQHLPECRAFERLTPNEDRGARLNSNHHLAADGNAMVFWSTSPFWSAAGTGNVGVTVARRTDNGWVRENADPGFGTRRYQGVAELQSPSAVSADMTRSLYFGSYPWHPDDQAVGNFRVSQSDDVYRREPDGTMTWITKPLDLPHTVFEGTILRTQSADLSRIVFAAPRRMTTDTVAAGSWNLYMHVDGEPIQLVSRGTDNAVLPAGNTLGSILNVSLTPSGKHLTFNVGGTQYVRRNADAPAAAQTKLFTTVIQEITGRACPSATTFSVQAGRATRGLLQFYCQERLTDDGHTSGPGTYGEYEYDLEAQTIRYVDPAAPAPEFFETDDALVPEDQNGVEDVYQRIDGEPHLITTGTSPHPAELLSSTADGESVFVLAGESLVPEDQDSGNYDIYVARRNGGFMQPEPVVACTVGCQGDLTAAPTVPTVASLSFVGSGNLLDVDPPAAVQPLRATAPAKAATGSSASLKVRVGGAGEVRVSGSGLRATNKRASKAGSVSLTVRLTQRSKERLARNGRVSAVATVRFVPSDGKSQTQRVRLRFKRSSKKQGTSRAGAARSASNGKGGR